MRDKSKKGTFLNGILAENPTFRLVLGMCPTLAVTTQALNGIAMGAAATFVMVCSGLAISLMRKVIPDKIRIPTFVIIIATFTSIVDLVMAAFMQGLHEKLGLFIPLIVVNCIIFARAESFAFRNPPLLSVLDGLGMGMGFTLALTVVGGVREIIGAGTLFGLQIMGAYYKPAILFIMAPGGFLTLGILLAVFNHVTKNIARKKESRA